MIGVLVDPESDFVFLDFQKNKTRPGFVVDRDRNIVFDSTLLQPQKSFPILKFDAV